MHLDGHPLTMASPMFSSFGYSPMQFPFSVSSYAPPEPTVHNNPYLAALAECKRKREETELAAMPAPKKAKHAAKDSSASKKVTKRKMKSKEPEPEPEPEPEYEYKYEYEYYITNNSDGIYQKSCE